MMEFERPKRADWWTDEYPAVTDLDFKIVTIMKTMNRYDRYNLLFNREQRVTRLRKSFNKQLDKVGLDEKMDVFEFFQVRYPNTNPKVVFAKRHYRKLKMTQDLVSL